MQENLAFEDWYRTRGLPTTRTLVSFYKEAASDNQDQCHRQTPRSEPIRKARTWAEGWELSYGTGVMAIFVQTTEFI